MSGRRHARVRWHAGARDGAWPVGSRDGAWPVGACALLAVVELAHVCLYSCQLFRDRVLLRRRPLQTALYQCARRVPETF